ncbi:MAG: GlsB/YeaQ/YmgE family stress response membrane protein [Steroidobacteraceae bacterium]
MGIISTIIVGLIVGALGRFVLPGDQKMGWIMTCLLGIAGSVVAGFLGRAVGWYEPGQGAGWIASIVGAALLLFVVQKVRAGKSG